MDSPSGQRGTRDALLHAAAQLVGERGWNAVTTRAIAERAGLPHGTVSYHFNGKQDLLRQAAMTVLGQVFTGLTDLVDNATASVPELVAASGTQLGAAVGESVDEVRLLAECLVQACRDDELALVFRDWLRAYREALRKRAAADGRSGALRAGMDPTGTAILVCAAIDGLWFHLAVDGELDVELACRTLARLLAPHG